jgi:diguanylate cyclase (GGDEF)-like protein/PAS domain S-box-containing protein
MTSTDHDMPPAVPPGEPAAETERNVLAQAQAHFRAVVETTDDAVITKTTAGLITSWNPGAERIFGYSEADMVGQSIYRLVPEDRHHEERFIQQMLSSGQKILPFETQRLHAQGHLVDLSVVVTPVFDAQGRVVSASKIARDIGPQKKLQERLQLISEVFTHTGEGVVITDPEGRILESNAAFARLTGYERVDALGMLPVMFRSSLQSVRAYESWLQVLRTEGYSRGELWGRRRNGPDYPALVSASAVRDAQGKVKNFIILVSDLTFQRQHQQQLEQATHYDTLTGLPNRLLLLDRLQQAMATTRRRGQMLAVFYLDLDNFKAINDRYGKLAGDQVLVGVSKNIKACLRAVDTLSRIGGDEFVGVLVDVRSLSDCSLMMERVRVAAAQPVQVENAFVQVNASIGMTLYPQDDADADKLLRHADLAMYEAKQNGRNRFQLFNAAHDAELRTRSAHLARIGTALEQREFTLYFQPKVNMRTGHVLGMEALIRWQHPTRGLLAPVEFLPLIEDTPLSDAVNFWVLDTALAQIQAWQREGIHLQVGVNMGARQLQQAGFVDALATRLQRYPDVPPGLLELEILETSSLADLDKVSGIMRSCEQLGVHFAVDDFGTGYSSLSYLKGLPAATLKIDQSFVRDMLVDREDLAIVQGVIGLADAFGRKVIAEGVETVEHGLRLLELGCELAQGYGIARPMPVEQVPAWIRSWKPDPSWARSS